LYFADAALQPAGSGGQDADSEEKKKFSAQLSHGNSFRAGEQDPEELNAN